MIPRHLRFKGQNEPPQHSEPISGAGNLPQWLRSSGNTELQCLIPQDLTSKHNMLQRLFSLAIRTYPPCPHLQVAQDLASHPVLHV